MKTRHLAFLAAVLAVALVASGCYPKRQFYDLPSSLPPEAGDVIRTTPVLLNFKGDVAAHAVMYRSTSASGEANAVTGTVYVPRTEWTGPSSRPLVGFAPGTQGLGDTCAPSANNPFGGFYELSIVKDMLAMGWAVAVTDYEGLGPPGDHTYVIKDAAGHALLDIVRAAQRMPEFDLGEDSPVGLWGYSEGGQAAAAAAEIETAYAPELDIKGVVAGGVPSDLRGMMEWLDGDANEWFAVLAFAAVGLNAAYPELDLPSYLNDAGTTLFDSQRSICLFDALPIGSGHHISELTTSHPMETPQWQARVEEQRLGTVAPTVPVFQYHGTSDQVVPFVQGTTLRDAWCAGGTHVEFTELATEHINGIFVGAPLGRQWLSERFDEAPLAAGCGQ